MELQTRNQPRLLDFLLNPAEALYNEANDTQAQLNQNVRNLLLNPEQLRTKASIILSKRNNWEAEGDFRRTCLSNKKNSTSSPQLTEAYQAYAKAYHQITSLYITKRDGKRTYLIIYDTENEKEVVKGLETIEKLDSGTCITQLPNGELFCFGNWIFSGIALIIDCDYQVRILPSGVPCSFSSAIYFNGNIYCFGGTNKNENLTLSCKFDLNNNRWSKLTSMPKADRCCQTVIFNRNILISGYENRNLLLYSIDTDSFSAIPYNFETNKKKIVIYTERLFLIECSYEWLIYESEVGYEYNWKLIASSVMSIWPFQVYWAYNKGAIYILNK